MSKTTEDRYLTPSETARMFGVSPSTLTKWALAGKVPFGKTPTGYRRYREADILALINRGEGD
jgi:DNA-binding transcriptional MerR regulator